jgi:hypothetical protein
VKKILKKMKGRRFRWIYLGEDVFDVISIEGEIRGQGQKFEITELLQEVARSLRQRYIDYIGKLNRENKSLRWWASSVSERSPYNSKTFLHSCYIKTCMDILKKYPNESFVIFVKKRAVRKSLIKNVETVNLEHIEEFGESFRETFRNMGQFILYKGWFLVSSFYRMATAKYAYGMQKRIIPPSPTLINTWVDKRSFDEKGAYRDSYFGKLPEYLKNNNKNVVIVPHVLGTIPYREAVAKMVGSDLVFLVPHSFLSISDVFGVFFEILANKPKKSAFPRFENIEISDLIFDDLKNDWNGARVAFDLLIYRFVRRLSEKGIPVDTVIYPYENQIWERVLCAATRRFYPSAYLIGYQHTTIYKMYLNYFLSKHEVGVLPFPDKVITNGRRYKEVLTESGYPEGKVVQGGAIRYAYLLKPSVHEERKKGDKRVILVTPSISESDAVELIWKVLEAFRSHTEYKVIIKCHPAMPFERISKRLKVELPKHFFVSDGPVADLLKGSDVLLYTYSTTCVEAIAAGVPVVHVEPDLSIDLDPLEFDPEARLSARNPEEIVKRVEEAIAMDEKELSKKRETWSGVVRGLFGKVDDSTYRLFLKWKPRFTATKV